MTAIYGDVILILNPWVAGFIACCYVGVAFFKYGSR
jgi:hypothetical protein